MRTIIALWCSVLFLWMAAVPAFAAGLYTLKSDVRLRKGPGLEHEAVATLEHNRSLKPFVRSGRWYEVETPSGMRGFVREDMVSDVWIKVLKQERRLFVMKGDRAVKDYRIALAPANPLGDKVKRGDSGTPEGRFFVTRSVGDPRQVKYGARSLLISYPDVEDARRGLRDGLIDFRTYRGIVRAVRAGRTPNQKTILGGSIQIHGGGSDYHWTLGCVALDDRDIIEMYDMVPKNVRVEIYRSARQDREFNAPDYLSLLILGGAKKQLVKPALYTEGAAAGIALTYPMGDIRPEWAVCTDVVIRALREAGPDLQALLYEDIILHPNRYQRWVKKPSYHIDHRRTRNLQAFFTHHARILPDDGQFKPGDVVIMDTGISNGTVFDHIGIVGDQKDAQGLPLVINIWTTGLRTDAMDLLGNGYPEVVGHFRLGHPFDYQ